MCFFVFVCVVAGTNQHTSEVGEAESFAEHLDETRRVVSRWGIGPLPTRMVMEEGQAVTFDPPCGWASPRFRLEAFSKNSACKPFFWLLIRVVIYWHVPQGTFQVCLNDPSSSS